jgi:hypothetical protein
MSDMTRRDDCETVKGGALCATLGVSETTISLAQDGNGNSYEKIILLSRHLRDEVYIFVLGFSLPLIRRLRWNQIVRGSAPPRINTHREICRAPAASPISSPMRGKGVLYYTGLIRAGYENRAIRIADYYGAAQGN